MSLGSMTGDWDTVACGLGVPLVVGFELGTALVVGCGLGASLVAGLGVGESLIVGSGVGEALVVGLGLGASLVVGFGLGASLVAGSGLGASLVAGFGVASVLIATSTAEAVSTWLKALDVVIKGVKDTSGALELAKSSIARAVMLLLDLADDVLFEKGAAKEAPGNRARQTAEDRRRVQCIL